MNISKCHYCNSDVVQSAQPHGRAKDLWIVICPDCRTNACGFVREVDAIRAWNKLQAEICNKNTEFWDIWDAPENEYLYQ